MLDVKTLDLHQDGALGGSVPCGYYGSFPDFFCSVITTEGE